MLICAIICDVVECLSQGYSTGQSLILNEPYNNTYVLMFDITDNPTGAKISHLKEFMDSAFVEGFRKRLLDTLQTSKKP
jgi:hypothetical protein